MKLSLNIQLTLSIVLGTMLVSNLGSAIAEIPETSQTDTPLFGINQLENASLNKPDPPESQANGAGDPDKEDPQDEDSECPENDTSVSCMDIP